LILSCYSCDYRGTAWVTVHFDRIARREYFNYFNIPQQKCFTVKKICLLVAMATFVLVLGVVGVVIFKNVVLQFASVLISKIVILS
jgi:hypothetical protein